MTLQPHKTSLMIENSTYFILPVPLNLLLQLIILYTKVICNLMKIIWSQVDKMSMGILSFIINGIYYSFPFWSLNHCVWCRTRKVSYLYVVSPSRIFSFCVSPLLFINCSKPGLCMELTSRSNLSLETPTLSHFLTHTLK